MVIPELQSAPGTESNNKPELNGHMEPPTIGELKGDQSLGLGIYVCLILILFITHLTIGFTGEQLLLISLGLLLLMGAWLHRTYQQHKLNVEYMQSYVERYNYNVEQSVSRSLIEQDNRSDKAAKLNDIRIIVGMQQEDLNATLAASRDLNNKLISLSGELSTNIDKLTIESQ